MNNKKGFFIIEAVIAMLVFSISILSLYNYQKNIIQVTADSYYRITATYLADSIIGQLTIDKDNLDKYIQSDMEYVPYKSLFSSISQNLPNVSENKNIPEIIKLEDNGIVRINIIIYWQNPFNDFVSTYTTMAIL